MWPMFLDMNRDECKRVLRRIELEAYSSLVSTFRAQGDLSKEKKKMLQDLQHHLSISTERHRAEVRRAVNDEKLATIADSMFGSNTTAEWLIEGRRLIPLMPRLVPQTAFTVTANQVANLQAEKNAAMPFPSLTGNKDLSTPSPVSTPTPPTVMSSKVSRPSSPASNVVVLPSGMSIHIKGGLNTDDEDENPVKKRKRSQSLEGLVTTASTQTRVSYSTASTNTLQGMSPMKITISKSPQARGQSSSSAQPQKVILVTSSGQTTTSNILHKSITVPVVRTNTTTSSTASQSRSSVIFPGTSTNHNSNLGNVITMAAPATSASSPITVMGTTTTAFLTPTISMSKPRPKTLPRQRLPQPLQKPGVVIPMGPSFPGPQTLQNIQIKQVPKQPSTIQIKQEGGMKIITQSLPIGTSKILPKPTQYTSSGTPVVVVSAGSTGTSTSNVTMLTRPGSTITAGQPGTKILNITTQGGKVISTSSKSNVVTVNPKTLHLHAVKTASGAKPNVIVVQKTQPKRGQSASGITRLPGTTTVLSSSLDKDIMQLLQKQDSNKQIIVTTSSASGTKTVEKKVIVTAPSYSDLGRQSNPSLLKPKTDADSRTSSLLAELIQAAGIVPDGGDGSGEVTISLDESTVAALTAVTQSDSSSQTKAVSSQSLPNNEWFEYDVGEEPVQHFSGDTAEAIQSLLDMQASESGQPRQKVSVQRSASIDLGQLSEPLSQQQYYTIEQAMSLLNQVEKEESPGAGSVEVQYVHSDSLESVQSQGDSQLSQSQSSVLSDAGETTDSGDTAASTPQASSGTEMEHIGPQLNRELLHGELDPQTGLFYAVSKLQSANQEGIPQTTVLMPRISTRVGDLKTLDLLSSSLAQAQIDLDNYQFIEEDLSGDKTDLNQNSNETADSLVKILHKTGEDLETDVQEGSAELFSTSDGLLGGSTQYVIQRPVQSLVQTTASREDPAVLSDVMASRPGVSTIHVRPSSFIPLQDVGKTKSTTINIVTCTQPSAMQLVGNKPVTVKAVDSGPSVVAMMNLPIVSTDDGSIPVHVAMEPSGLDAAHMKMEDFSSQQEDYIIDQLDDRPDGAGFDDVTGGSGSDSQGDGSQYSDPNNLLRSSTRKRKIPMSADGTSQQPTGGWIRAALGLLQKVSRYRGIHREKGELNAAAWFTQPVDIAEAPDYYEIVKSPMDFGTIKQKLESGDYVDFEDFHADMILIQDNCFVYNPLDSIVCRDCKDVFSFYEQESNKLMEKWQKSHIHTSPSPKKSRLDKSPVRP